MLLKTYSRASWEACKKACRGAGGEACKKACRGAGGEACKKAYRGASGEACILHGICIFGERFCAR